ncbi:hypothetical protein, partial [Salmonella sp. s51228]|uniref:hypothetical protein n=1 Tax=Salmonella sp. s51228 TaxID=3159652 RepID=UPI00398146A4
IFTIEDEAAQNEFHNFKCNVISDLFVNTHQDNKLSLNFTETGIAYGNTEISSMEVKCEIGIKTTFVDFTARLIIGVRMECGINFAAIIEIKHANNQISTILIPGTRTYDPAGITGDPHSSE